MQKHYQERYLCKTYKELIERVSLTLSETPKEYDNYVKLLGTQTFIPAGNTLLAGVADITPNCSVLGLLTEDNFEDMLQLSVKLWKQRTGVGFNLSGLDDPVARLRELSAANDAIDLGHRPKRGNMAVLDASHPKIKEFITCKTSYKELYNFNISVGIRGELDDELLVFIAQAAWATGDPGLVFLDVAETYGPVKALGLEPVVTCVPCGEQFFHQYETCNLGSLNLNSPALLNDNNDGIDESCLRVAVHLAVSLMDSVVDRLVYPDQRVAQVSLGARRLGLGVMGWADHLKRINIPYDSQEALDLAKHLSKLITSFAEEKSRDLALAKGPCAHSQEYRNLSLTCIAPTGGITGLTENKGYGIEPWFSEALFFSPQVHIDMQAAWQSGIHNAVSKTVNLPNSATMETVIQTYRYARQVGVKGITIYRDGSKFAQPISLCPECI